MQNKKILILIPVLAVVLAVSGCGKKETPKPVVNNNNNVQRENQNTNVNTNANINTNSNIPDEPEVAKNGEEEIDTSDWLTYRNEEYGFEVRYPKDWKDRFNQSGQQEDDGELIKYKNLFYIDEWGKSQKEGTEFYDGAYFKISILKDSESINLNEFVENNIKSKEKTQKIEEIIFNNLQSFETTKKITYADHIIEQSFINTIYLKFNEDIYRIVFYAVGPKYILFNRTLEQIKNSFIFINNKVTKIEDEFKLIGKDENGWNIYRSDGYGFEIKYPEFLRVIGDKNISITNVREEDQEFRAHEDGEIWIDINNAKNDEISVFNKIGQVEKGYSGQLGNTTNRYYNFELLNFDAVMWDREYSGGEIELNPGVVKTLYFQNTSANTVNIISADIPNKNKKQIELFNEILKTIKLID